ncbi:hypothetical protein R6Q57_016424 [Mikania cordata]
MVDTHRRRLDQLEDMVQWTIGVVSERARRDGSQFPPLPKPRVYPDDGSFSGPSGASLFKSTSGGDDTPVDEVEVLQRSLDQRRGHVRGVGRNVKSITPNLPPHMYAPATNELQQQLAEANARWAEQKHINEMMQQQIKKLMSMQGGQGSSSFYYPGFETNQEKDQDQEEDEDEDESE